LVRIVVVINPFRTYGHQWALPRCGSAPYLANKSQDHIPVRQPVAQVVANPVRTYERRWELSRTPNPFRAHGQRYNTQHTSYS